MADFEHLFEVGDPKRGTSKISEPPVNPPMVVSRVPTPMAQQTSEVASRGFHLFVLNVIYHANKYEYVSACVGECALSVCARSLLWCD